MPAAHRLDLPEQVVDGLVAPRQIDLRRLDDEQRRGRVVEEEVVVGLVELGEVFLARQRPSSSSSARAARSRRRRFEQVGRRLQIDDERRAAARSRATQIEQPLIDEQLVVVEVHERVDAVALEEVVADRRLTEEIALTQGEQLAMAREREEELRLERRAGAAGVEIGQKRILAFVEHDGRVETRAEPLGQRVLPRPIGPSMAR